MPAEAIHMLLARARVGDTPARERAFAELLRLLSIFVRGRMGSHLRDHRDSDDVCQSIARSFFEDFGEGDVSFESDAAVMAYLKVVVRTKLALIARHDGTLKRGGDVAHTPLDASNNSGSAALVAPTGPSGAEGELKMREGEALEHVRTQLTEQEQEIARLRLAGVEWNVIAARLGGDAALLRKQWSRVVERIAKELES